MNPSFPVRAVSGCFALACFGVAVLSGLMAGRPADAVLSSALVSLIVGQFVGLAAGVVLARTFAESLRAHVAALDAAGPGAETSR
ncbi:MAG: hypothetical protein SFZ24_02065 [Planctomycetota bacterium]|nr:hypothetical protein [Planctomycetota bacterium]